jgi:hypothetical protein
LPQHNIFNIYRKLVLCGRTRDPVEARVTRIALRLLRSGASTDGV